MKFFVKLIRRLKRLTKKRTDMVQNVFYILFGFLLLFFITTFSFFFYFNERIYPGVFIASIHVGGLKKDEALKLLKEKTIPDKITLYKKDNNGKTNPYAISLSEINLTYNDEETVNNAFKIGRNKKVFPQLLEIAETVYNGKNINYQYTYSSEKLDGYLSTIASQIFDEPIKPTYKVEQKTIIVDKGKAGMDLNKDEAIAEINNQLSSKNFEDIAISTKFIDLALTDEEAAKAHERATKVYNKKIEFTSHEYQRTTEAENIVSLLDPRGGYNKTNIEKLVGEIKTKIDRKPQNPVFVFDNSVVKEFSPAKDGYEVQEDKLNSDILYALSVLETDERTSEKITIPLKNTPPDYQTSDVNNLGIKELIGKGESYFRGSIPSRVHNVGLAASKFNGILVKPGETLSFNQILGDVSKFTGYQQAYIIQDGKTVLGDGGGVCQVSTTLFRAALDAGLDVSERKAHSYRVSYYEQGSHPGIDATVYYPTSDLKIVNNTNNYILIQSSIDKKNYYLTFEIYGTKDGRVSEVTIPKVTGVTPPPEDLYIDDPTLPVGQIKQIDWKAWGAKVSFNYKVTKDGNTMIEKTFYSNYRPWQAKFLRGTMPR